MKENINVVVIGGVHHNTLGVIRSLGESRRIRFDIDVIIIDEHLNRKNFVVSSKYIKKNKAHIVGDNKDIINVLLRLKEDGLKRVIICCSDSSVEQVMSNVSKLEEFYYCLTTTVPISDLLSKEHQINFAKELGLIIPETKIISNSDKLSWNVFPCIIKPDNSTGYLAKSDIHIVRSIKDLEETIMKSVSNRLLVQEFVSKEMEYQLIGCSLDKGNKIIIPGYTRIIRQPENTNTGYLEYTPIDRLDYPKENVRRFIQKIGYSGLFSVEFIRDKNGKDYFLEINLRNDGNAYCVTSAGINLPLIWCYYQTHKELPNVNMSFSKSIKFMPELSDIKRGVKEVGIFRWLWQFMTAKSHAVFNLKDIKPFFRKIIDHKK